jgi:hypothetical protein
MKNDSMVPILIWMALAWIAMAIQMQRCGVQHVHIDNVPEIRCK